MKTRLLYFFIASVCLSSCLKDDSIYDDKDETIRINVTDTRLIQTRAYLYDSYDDILAGQDFSLDAYLTEDESQYLNDVWVYYFLGNWRFRDVVNDGNLIDYYWPNGSKVNFLAHIPRDLSKSIVNPQNLHCGNDGVTFSCTLPSVINDRTSDEREIENSREEFIYAARLNRGKEDGPVHLRFVHPFAAVRFRLMQSHRDLMINHIKFSDISTSGVFSDENDTYEPYQAGESGQPYLTYEDWKPEGESGEMQINLSKIVPDDVNYHSAIGGPYLVMPQSLENVQLSVNYSWDKYQDQESAKFFIFTDKVTAWQPGMIYTYYLDLGDNREEILFRVEVEEWIPGEEGEYENSFDVN